MLFTDHKPLVGLVKVADLVIPGNTKVLRMLQQMLRWRFSVTLVPGETKSLHDALLRFP